MTIESSRSVLSIVYDNRKFAQRAFYCLACLNSLGEIPFAFLNAFEKYRLLSKPTELAIAVMDRLVCDSR